MSLAGVLAATLVLSVLALGLVRLSVGHLWLSARSNSTLAASSLSNSAVSAAIAKISERPTYGATDPDIELSSEVGRALVTFSRERANDAGVPFSTNNLEGTTPAEGYGGRPVPAGTAYIIGTSWAGNSRRTTEAMLRMPPFPWAILTGGKLVTSEKVLIGTIPDGEWPPPPDSELLPADVLANAIGERSVVLAGDCTITGDVESPGGIVLEGNEVNVKGEVRPGVDPVEVPTLKAATYDPVALGTDYEKLAGLDKSAEVELIGSARHQGPMEVGGLKLDGAQLFVDGDLTVSGSISGNGVLICTGDVEVRELSLEGSTELAVLADGKVDLTGSGRTGSMVRGIFYAGDSLSAKNLTVVGTVVAGKPTGQVRLDNARVLAEPAPEPRMTTRSDTIYVGRAFPPAPGAAKGTANVTAISWERPDYRYAFTVKPGPPGPNNGYPITLEIGPGFLTPRGGRFVIRKYKDMNKIVDFLGKQTTSGKMKNNTVGLPKVNWKTLMSLVAGAAGLQGSNEEIELTTVSLAGDLSKFLPFEDRVRIVSWFEY